MQGDTPAEVRLDAELGAKPLDHDYLRRLCADGLEWHSDGMPEHTLCVALPQALDEIERLRAMLEVSQAATAEAVSQAKWQARTNAELNALHDEVRRLKAEACRRLNDEFGA
jgi:hypothetical protein